MVGPAGACRGPIDVVACRGPAVAAKGGLVELEDQNGLAYDMG